MAIVMRGVLELDGVDELELPLGSRWASRWCFLSCWASALFICQPVAFSHTNQRRREVVVVAAAAQRSADVAYLVHQVQPRRSRQRSVGLHKYHCAAVCCSGCCVRRGFRRSVGVDQRMDGVDLCRVQHGLQVGTRKVLE